MMKVQSSSSDLTQENINKLKKFFPEVITDGNKIDFDQLKAVLGTEVEDEKERYSFNWFGKRKSLIGAQQPSKGTLRPDQSKSKNFDTTENLYIEGDNLEVLKLLQKSYSNKVKVIYIDPPYNTGKDFVYKDDYRDGIKNYLEQTGQVSSEGHKLSTKTESSGHFHTDWLNMMYPRLKLSKNLLTDDGVIFISIDDNELNNLIKICDEIFGEKNRIANLIWEKKKKGSFLSNSVTNVKEYILVYSKNVDKMSSLIGEINSETETYPCINANNKRETRKIRAGIKSKYKEGNYSLPEGTVISDKTMNIKLLSDLKIVNNVLAEDLKIEGNWRYSQKAMEEYATKKELYITRDLYIRRIVKDSRYKTIKDLLPRVGTKEGNLKKFNMDNLFEDGWGSNEDADEEQRLLFGVQGVVSYPKPTKLIMKLLTSVRDKDAIVLDFFSGSGTTAEAVMRLNALDGGERRSILVQLPEDLKKSLKTAKGDSEKILNNSIEFLNSINKPKILTEIGAERIRRSGEKLKKELWGNNVDGMELNSESERANKIDIGFKVLKLDTSNIREWNTDFENLGQELDFFEEIFVEGRSELDVVYEIMIKNGLELTYPVNQIEINKKNIYDVASGNLFICLDDNIDIEIARAIIEKKNEYGVETSSVVFKDSGFNGNDSEKLNVIELLKDAGYPEENLLTI